jgi:predicted NBD/HSP70 family sugar kinase
VSLDFGIDIGGTNIKLGLVESKGKVVARRNLATKARRGPHQALERIAATIETMR